MCFPFIIKKLTFLGRPVPSPHPHIKRKILICHISILKPVKGENPSSFLKHLVTNICFGLLSLFIPLDCDLKEVTENAMLFGGGVGRNYWRTRPLTGSVGGGIESYSASSGSSIHYQWFAEERWCLLPARTNCIMYYTHNSALFEVLPTLAGSSSITLHSPTISI